MKAVCAKHTLSTDEQLQKLTYIYNCIDNINKNIANIYDTFDIPDLSQLKTPDDLDTIAKTNAIPTNNDFKDAMLNTMIAVTGIKPRKE